MTYEQYRFLFIGGASLCVIMLVVSTILFFTLKIPRVIGDLTGANARRAIEAIRSQNEGSGVKTYKSSLVNRERGKITDQITATGRLLKQPNISGGAMKTEKIETEVLVQQAREAQQARCSENTTLLTAQDQTSSETTVLDTGIAASNETTVLSQQENYYPLPVGNDASSPYFEIEFEITYIHSDVLVT